MIDIIAGAHAPDNVVAFGGHVIGFVAFVTVTTRTVAGTFATTIVITDDVVTIVRRVTAGTYPGDRGKFGAGRAGGCRAATISTQKTIHGAIAPVFTFCWIAGITRYHTVIGDLR